MWEDPTEEVHVIGLWIYLYIFIVRESTTNDLNLSSINVLSTLYQHLFFTLTLADIVPIVYCFPLDLLDSGKFVREEKGRKSS